MIQLGKTQCLNVIKKTDFGVYLGTEDDKVYFLKAGARRYRNR